MTNHSFVSEVHDVGNKLMKGGSTSAALSLPTPQRKTRAVEGTGLRLSSETSSNIQLRLSHSRMLSAANGLSTPKALRCRARVTSFYNWQLAGGSARWPTNLSGYGSVLRILPVDIAQRTTHCRDVLQQGLQVPPLIRSLLSQQPWLRGSGIAH